MIRIIRIKGANLPLGRCKCRSGEGSEGDLREGFKGDVIGVVGEAAEGEVREEVGEEVEGYVEGDVDGDLGGSLEGALQGALEAELMLSDPFLIFFGIPPSIAFLESGFLEAGFLTILSVESFLSISIDSSSSSTAVVSISIRSATDTAGSPHSTTFCFSIVSTPRSRAIYFLLDG